MDVPLRKVVDQTKTWFYTVNPPFFRLEKSGWPEKKKSEFAEPLFYTFLEKRLQIKCSSEPSLPIYLYLTAYKYQSYLLAFRIFDETQIPFSS